MRWESSIPMALGYMIKELRGKLIVRAINPTKRILKTEANRIFDKRFVHVFTNDVLTFVSALVVAIGSTSVANGFDNRVINAIRKMEN